MVTIILLIDMILRVIFPIIIILGLIYLCVKLYKKYF